MRFFISIAFVIFTGDVLADLYRWIDPATGSIKYSSYPPPWYGDPALEKHSPPVEVIPSSASKSAAVPAAPAAAPKAEGLALLEERFKSLLQQLTGLPTSQDFARGGAGMQQHMEAYRAAAAELDRLDPKGAERRRTESKPILDRIVEALRAQFPGKPPAPPPPPLPATK